MVVRKRAWPFRHIRSLALRIRQPIEIPEASDRPLHTKLVARLYGQGLASGQGAAGSPGVNAGLGGRLESCALRLLGPQVPFLRCLFRPRREKRTSSLLQSRVVPGGWETVASAS